MVDSSWSLFATLALFTSSLTSSGRVGFQALAFSAGAGAGGVSRRGSVGRAAHAGSSLRAAPAPLAEHDVAGCFGRLADKDYVVPPREVTGTAASGYEFGVLQSGRPKWLCAYLERTGQTQGGGADLTHVPRWRGVLFGGEGAEGLLTATGLAEAVESAPFEMPLGPSPGLKQRAAGMSTDGGKSATVEALWRLLGGDDGGDGVTEETVAASLARAATEYGSGGDSMTYAAFKRALEAQQNLN